MASRITWVALACMLGATGSAHAQLAWDVESFRPAPNGVVSIVIDTTRVGSDVLLAQASVTITYLSASKQPLMKRSYELVKPGTLAAGKSVVFDIPHAVDKAVAIEASKLSWSTHAEGYKADEAGMPGQATVRGGTVPPAERRRVKTFAALAAQVAVPPNTRSCNAYAALAKAQQDVNIDNACGFTAMPRWSSEVGAHHAWCMSAGVDAAAAEAVERSRLLVQSCGKKS